ncbi:hypothetical protein C5167_040599 [Papaver somniferum]|uniref:Uncharacterized protein n=1 Tax=Papaver somniferum TaxID=3469 RepID=A0A4Y7IJL6_PAPSO|nr:hypothetical protein C5167_040599 [Papaver somniferum]
MYDILNESFLELNEKDGSSSYEIGKFKTLLGANLATPTYKSGDKGNESTPMFIAPQQQGGVTSRAQSNVGNSSQDSSIHQDLSNSSFQSPVIMNKLSQIMGDSIRYLHGCRHSLPYGLMRVDDIMVDGEIVVAVG